jgi:hypothetical protein
LKIAEALVNITCSEPSSLKAKHAEIIMPDPQAPGQSRKQFFSALSQADESASGARPRLTLWVVT